jgi:peptidylprolyl isomerase
MKTILNLFVLTLLWSSLMTPATPADAQTDAVDLENQLILELTTGTVKIQMLPEKAPKHVERIKKLTQEDFYDNVVFHRVIEGFMAQSGDPTGTGRGGSDYPDIPAEFNDVNFDRGTVGMARAREPESANSQFFICFDDCSFLNGQYTVWGEVTEGMEHVDRLARGEPPASPDMIVEAKLGTEIEAE